VPIALMDARDGEFADQFRDLHAYLQQHYRAAGQVEFWGVTFDVLVDSRLTPVRTWGEGLPCYR
jgi:hypothetical protein